MSSVFTIAGEVSPIPSSHTVRLYKIQYYDGEDIIGTFYEPELQVVTPGHF